MMKSDGLILLALGSAVLLLTIVTETAWRRGCLPQWLSRKILHIGAVGACALAPLWLQDLTALRWIVAVVAPILIYMVATRRLFSEVNGRCSWGIALFPLAYLVLLVFAPNKFLIVIPMAILAVSDAAAAIAGQLFARRFFQLTGDRKSLVGCLTFFGSAFLVVLVSQCIFPLHWIDYDFEGNVYIIRTFIDDPFNWGKIGFVVLLLSALEALGSNGFDNLLVPLAAALLLQPFFGYVNRLEILELWIGVVVSIGFVFFTVRRRWLTWDGAVTAALIGLWVLFFSGLIWVWALIFFFGSSTLLGRLKRHHAVVSDAKHGRPRDFRQVLCNGGIYAFLATFSSGPNMPVLLTMTVSLAVSTADTWASEIGTYFRGRTYDIWRWQPTPVGLSGGVSWAGTLGGLVGAATMAQGGFLFNFQPGYGLLAVIVTAAGFAGMLLDSLLGATLQARYRDEETGDLTDIPTNILHSGYPWMSNDAVNLLSNVLIVVVVGCVLSFLHF